MHNDNTMIVRKTIVDREFTLYGDMKISVIRNTAERSPKIFRHFSIINIIIRRRGITIDNYYCKMLGKVWTRIFPIDVYK